MSNPTFQPVIILLLITLIALIVLGARRPSRFGSGGQELSQLLREWQRRIVVLCILGVREFSRFEMLGGSLSHLQHELKRRMPVYSAETIQGKEAEFIRDSLPKRFPIALVLIALVLFGAMAWWLRA